MIIENLPFELFYQSTNGLINFVQQIDLDLLHSQLANPNHGPAL